MRIPVLPPYKEEYASAYVRNDNGTLVVDLYKANTEAKYTADCLSLIYANYKLAEKLNRRLEDGEIAVFMDGDSTNVTLDNLELGEGPAVEITPPTATPKLENIQVMPSARREPRPVGLKTNRNRA